jgi:hypothetical protein
VDEDEVVLIDAAECEAPVVDVVVVVDCVVGSFDRSRGGCGSETEFPEEEFVVAVSEGTARGTISPDSVFVSLSLFGECKCFSSKNSLIMIFSTIKSLK